MPTSDLKQIPDVVETVRAWEPESILDIGIGFGKYALLLREYMEGQSRSPVDALGPRQRNLRIDGLEVFPQYVTAVHRELYDRVLTGDVAELAEGLDAYDVIMMIDVIEHLPREAAVRTVDALLSHARKGVVISTPLEPAAQGATYGNAHEAHVDVWDEAAFGRWPGAMTLRSGGQLLVAIASEGGANPWVAVQRAKRGVLWPLRRWWWRRASRRPSR